MSNTLIDKELEYIEGARVSASLAVREKRQKLNEQYFTPGYVSKYIGDKLIRKDESHYKILDAASGVGNLGAHLALSIRAQCAKKVIHVCSVEIDNELSVENGSLYKKILTKHNVSYKSVNSDFFSFYKESFHGGSRYNRIVMNPPYRKFSRKEYESHEFNGDEIVYSPNMYSVFISCGLSLLEDGGELIAIVPRSFCSGVQFRNFREKMFQVSRLEYIHLFNSRTEVFSFDKIQQETVILKLSKRKVEDDFVNITFGDDLSSVKVKKYPLSKVIFSKDSSSVIHIPHENSDDNILDIILSYKNNLDTLNLSVSTGKVVDFRNLESLVENKRDGVAYLFCKENLGRDVFWLNSSKKPNYLFVNNNTRKMLLNNQCHVVLNRMFFKEQGKAVVCQVIDLSDVNECVAIENHLNYISGKEGFKLTYELAVGVKKYLESELVSLYFKRFIGSTQINASDLRRLPFPAKEQLIKLARS